MPDAQPNSRVEMEGDLNPAGNLNETDPDTAPDNLDPDQAPDPDEELDLVGSEADSGEDLEHPATVLPGGFIDPHVHEEDCDCGQQ